MCGGGGIIKEKSICTISVDGYHSKYLKLIKEKYKNAETFVASVLAKEFQWEVILKEYLQSKQENLQKDFQRRKNADLKCENLNIFAKLFKYGTQNYNLIYYPGISLPIDLNKSDKNFFFKQPVDFKALQQRNKQSIIALFGPSTMQESYMDKESDTLVFKLQALEQTHKNPRILLNFGITGFTLYEQFLLYASLIYPLKPEIVVAVFFGVDIFSSRVSCETLLEQHAIFYGGGFLEKEYRDLTQSILPMKYQLLQAGEKPALNNDSKILEAIQMRLAQFNAMVTSYGGKFYPIITPLLACKKEWSEEEKENHFATLKDFKNIAYEDTRREVCLIEAFKAMPRDFALYDGNDAIREAKETLFMDFIHLTPQGNTKFAEYLINLVC